MMMYIFMIDYVLPTCLKVLAHVLPAMERTQGLLGTLEAVFERQVFPVQRVFTIIEPFNVVHLGTVSKCNHIFSIYA
jgi:hypothetical protein